MGQRLSYIVMFRDVIVGAPTDLVQALLGATRTLILNVRSCVVHSLSTEMPSPLPVRLHLPSDVPRPVYCFTTSALRQGVLLRSRCPAVIAVIGAGKEGRREARQNGW